MAPPPRGRVASCRASVPLGGRGVAPRVVVSVVRCRRLPRKGVRRRRPRRCGVGAAARRSPPVYVCSYRTVSLLGRPHDSARQQDERRKVHVDPARCAQRRSTRGKNSQKSTEVRNTVNLEALARRLVAEETPGRRRAASASQTVRKSALSAKKRPGEGGGHRRSGAKSRSRMRPPSCHPSSRVSPRPWHPPRRPLARPPRQSRRAAPCRASPQCGRPRACCS